MKRKKIIEEKMNKYPVLRGPVYMVTPCNPKVVVDLLSRKEMYEHDASTG